MLRIVRAGFTPEHRIAIKRPCGAPGQPVPRADQHKAGLVMLSAALPLAFGSKRRRPSLGRAADIRRLSVDKFRILVNCIIYLRLMLNVFLMA